MKKLAFILAAFLVACASVFANPGDLDPSFGQSGRETVTIPGSSTSETGNAVAFQADGKAVAVGTCDGHIAIARLNADATPDQSFGLNGKVASPAGIEGDGVALQPDGKIIVSGVARIGTQQQFMIARFLSSGDLDLAFGTNGSTTTAFGNANALRALAVALQSDGKIVAAGRGGGPSEVDFGVARLNSDGSLDSTFGNGGTVSTHFPGPGTSFDEAHALAIQPDGKILVAGETDSLSTGAGFGVARYLTNGTLDPSFGTGGLVAFTYGMRRAIAYAIGLQSSGKIIVSGQLADTDVSGYSGGVVMARLTSNGDLDSTFGSGGIATTKIASTSSGDGTGSAARFFNPLGVAVDNAGDVYVADTSHQTIRKIAPGAVVTTIAGSVGNPGSADGNGANAQFSTPYGVAADNAGNVYVADTGNHTIRKVTSSGNVTTIAGLAGSAGGVDGNAGAARFSSPQSVAIDSAGNVYVADTGNSTIRKIAPSGDVITLAGLAGSTGSSDGNGSAARFNAPKGIAVDSAGNLYVADTYNDTIRKISSTGDVTTVAGMAGAQGSTDGAGSVARFLDPEGVSADSSGNLYVSDSGNSTVRKISSSGSVTTLAGLAGNFGLERRNRRGRPFQFPIWNRHRSQRRQCAGGQR